MQLFVSYEFSEHKENALNLAKDLSLPFVPRELIDHDEYFDSYFFIYQPNHSFIRKGLGRLAKDIHCSFNEWSRKFTDPLLSKCLKGLPDDFTVLDATAGFGKDALQIAKNPNCHSVLLMEREKWLFYLLKEGAKNVEDTRSLNIVNKFSIVNNDSFKFLSNQELYFDLIYIDLMFKSAAKSKAKRTMQALRDLTEETNADGLLDVAITRAWKRVIVKRHKKSKFLGGIKPNHSVMGKVIRYDVYNSS